MRLAERAQQIAPSATLDITSKAKKMAAEGIDVVSFGAGEPDFDTPEPIKEAAIKAIKSGCTKYTPSSGTLTLREAIVEKFSKDNHLTYTPSQVVVSCGAKHSLYNIFQAICNPGDEVLIPSPYWLSYPEMVKMASAVPVYIQTSAAQGFKITEAALTAAITKKTKALIVNSPSNPTGCVYSKKELEMIARVAVSRNIIVISDEIYEKLVYDGAVHYSIGSLDKEIFERTVTVNGVSKSYAMTGWRIGYAAGPRDIMDAIANMQSHATSNPTSISQQATLAALTGDQECIRTMRVEFEARRNLMVERIGRIAGISCVKPDGAFYVFCDIAKLKIDSVVFATRLLDEAKVAVVAGTPFGAPSSIRLSFATSRASIEKGLARIEEWVTKHG